MNRGVWWGVLVASAVGVGAVLVLAWPGPGRSSLAPFLLCVPFVIGVRLAWQRLRR